MSPATDGNDRPVTIPLGPLLGAGPWAIAVGFIALVLLGTLGRLVPAPAAPAPTAAATVVHGPAPGVRLVSPFADVLYLRTTEVAVRGTAADGVEQLDASVTVGGTSIGEERIEVDATGWFDGLVSIVPPATRAVGVLEVRDPRSPDRLLAQVSFSVEAGALMLTLEPSKLRGVAGSTLVVDALVYGPLREIRGLLTGVDGTLIATGSTLVGPPRARDSWPRTIGVSIEIPLGPLPDRARLHVLAFDEAGTEVEHVDVNVALSSR